MKPGITELLIILVVVIILFGPTQIPKLTKMFGKSIKSFKEGMGEEKEDETTKEKEDEPKKESENETKKESKNLDGKD